MKKEQITLQMYRAISEIFNEESECYIGEVKQKDLNNFFLSLMVLMPGIVYGKITGEDNDPVDTLNVATRLLVLNSMGKLDEKGEIQKTDENRLLNNELVRHTLDKIKTEYIEDGDFLYYRND